MATYRLLRNNKESGPHSLDDLKQMGLKAYDLVWVDGKSAAWRYPGEVEELKSFAPQVEEQPFDRFFKKQPVEQKIERPQPTVPQPALAQPHDAYAVAPEHEKYVPKKSVFVTMPGKKTSSPAAVVPEETTTAAIASYQPKTSVNENPISITENPVAAEVKYSQPLDEIKEMYVKTLYDRKQKIARKTFWLQSMKKIAAIALLIAIGALAGWLIRSKSDSKKALATSQQLLSAQPSPANQVPAPTDDAAAAVPGNVTNSTPVDDLSAEQKQAVTDRTEREAPIVKERATANDKPADKKTIIPSDREEGELAATPGSYVDPTNGERGRRTRGDNNITTAQPKERKSIAATDVANQVSVKSNEYKRVAFGGIRNLELTVTNDSKYTLDNVIVELQYIKPNELPLKTETIEFKSIGPKSASTVRVPDTNRGIKVTYRIVQVHSSQMDAVAAGH